MVYEIKKYGEDVLKQIAKEVELNEINDEFRKFLDDMVETMYETDGVGLAAPQIGVSKRIFVCDDGNGVVRKVINPIVVPLTEETQEFEEGCLSVPGIYKKVERPKRVLLKYLNEYGEEIEEIVAVNKKIEEIKADIEKYDKKIASLDDEFEKEKVARNMFQMVKENEVIYKYVEKNNIKTEKTEEEK